uniref:Cysteine protease n=1 Tax=Parastrongyloides trichosuri TaxID=131310 RepID=A0A0N4ZJG0_PARTI
MDEDNNLCNTPITTELSNNTRRTWKETFTTVGLKKIPSLPTISIQQWKDRQQSIKNQMDKVINNVKYGQWNIYPNKDVNKDFDKKKHIFILGKQFNDSKFSSNNLLNFEQFLEYFKSRLWFTYRINIPSIPYSKETGDCGWGCMIRVMQMMTAQAYSKIFIDDNFSGNISDYREILSLFDDSSNGLLGLSNFVKYPYENYGKKVGSWFSPSEAAQVMNHLINTHKDKNNKLINSLVIYCSVNSCVEIDQLEIISDNWNKNILLIVPVRLGIKHVNGFYYEHIASLFSIENCLGIIGGRAKRSLYYVGYYDKSLIYLDPHVMQEYVDLEVSSSQIDSFFCSIPKKIPILQMDPSCAIGFIIKNKEELDSTVKKLSLHQIVTYYMADGFEKKVSNPIFTVVDHSSQISKYVPNTLDNSVSSNLSDDFEML